ncbi:class II glutamine amidotransferase, partial [Patescibacteria group bacterium]|nr:class II glutamine amidotransferase [Patescibacteria group bacterium]
MCGIVGYIGSRHASGVLIEGLRRLEYRGYDSAGLATVDSKEIQLVKVAGKIANLSSVVQVNPISGTVGIAHTRWATHGPPSDINAHPHLDCQGTIAVVHNGIIENFDKLRRKIIESGHQLRSETDTEVIAHLLEEQIQNKTFEEALFSVLVQLEGTFGLAMICTNEPRKIFAARRGSPLVLGLGKNRDEFFVASDPAAIISYTQDIMYLDDNEVAVLSDSGVETFSLDRNRTDKKIESIEITVGEMERGGYSHF